MSAALAVIAEVRKLVPTSRSATSSTATTISITPAGSGPSRREGVTVITHDVNRTFFERALAAPATVTPDHLAKSGRRARWRACATSAC